MENFSFDFQKFNFKTKENYFYFHKLPLPYSDKGSLVLQSLDNKPLEFEEVMENFQTFSKQEPWTQTFGQQNMEDVIKQFNQQISEMNTKLQEKEGFIETLEEELEKHRNDFQEIYQEQKNFQFTLRQKENQLNDLQEIHQNYKKEKELQLNKFEQHLKALQETQDMNQFRKKDNQETDFMEDFVKEKDDLRISLENKNKEITLLQQRVHRLSEMEKELEERNLKIEILERERDVNRQKIEELKEQISSFDDERNQIDYYKKSIEVLTEKLNNKNKRDDQIKEVIAKVRQLQEEIVQKNKEIQGLQEDKEFQCKNLENQIRDLKNQQRELEREKFQIQSESDQRVEQETEIVKRFYEQEIKKKEKQMQKNQREDIDRDLENEIDRLNKLIQMNQMEYQRELRRQQRDFETQINQIENSRVDQSGIMLINKKNKDLSKVIDEKEKMKFLVEDQKQKIEKLENQQQTWVMKYESILQENQDLQGRINQHKDCRKDQLEMRNHVLKTENYQLNKMLYEKTKQLKILEKNLMNNQFQQWDHRKVKQKMSY